MENFIKLWKEFRNLDILDHFRKLGKIYDSDNWSSTYHKEVDESILKWLYLQVIPFLALNKDLDVRARYVKEKDFIWLMRKWLQFAYKHKKQQVFGKRYFHHCKVLFVF